jgi:ketosteroid isomerase-like protein
MEPSPDRTTVEASVELVARAGALIASGFADLHDHPFADDVVFQLFNPQLPDLAGDHHGVDGIAGLFERLDELSETGFRNEPHSLTPFGEELLVAFATDTLSVDGVAVEVDAVVVWRVFGGQIHEAWDIPAVNTVRPART